MADIKSAFFLVKFLEDVKYNGARHFDAHAFRTEDYEGVKDFGRGCMRTYLILKEKAEQWNADKEIQAIIADINSDQQGASGLLDPYSKENLDKLRSARFDRVEIAKRGFNYERLDQLTMDILLGVR
jgi:xylose isomerase